MYKAFHLAATEIFTFKDEMNIYASNHLLGHKTCLKKFRRAENVQRMFSDHNSLKPEIKSFSQFEKRRKFPYGYKLKRKVINYTWLKK